MRHKIHTRMYPEIKVSVGTLTLPNVIFNCGVAFDIITRSDLKDGQALEPGDEPMGKDCPICFPKTSK